MRQMLTQEKIQENAAKFKVQMAKFIDFSEGKALMLDNADWLLGPSAMGWHWNASLPLLTHSAGGFILLGLILALLCHFNQDDAR